MLRHFRAQSPWLSGAACGVASYWTTQGTVHAVAAFGLVLLPVYPTIRIAMLGQAPDVADRIFETTKQCEKSGG